MDDVYRLRTDLGKFTTGLKHKIQFIWSQEKRAFLNSLCLQLLKD